MTKQISDAKALANELDTAAIENAAVLPFALHCLLHCSATELLRQEVVIAELEAQLEAVDGGNASAVWPDPWANCVEDRVFIGRLPDHIQTLVDNEYLIPIKLYTEQQVRELIEAAQAHPAQCEPAQCLQQSVITVLETAEAALSDIGDADREPGDDVAWCEARALQALPAVRSALASNPLQQSEPVPNVTATAPERIYLNLGDCPDDVDFAALDDLTWCADKIDDNDVEYVRADLAGKAEGAQS